VQRLHFDPFFLRQVDQQRRTHRAGNRVDVVSDSLDHIGSDGNSLCTRHSLHFTAAFEKLCLDVRVAPERPNRQPRRTGETGQRDQKNELLPDRGSPIIDGFRLNVSAAQRVMNGANPCRQSRQRAEYFTEDNPPMGSRLLDYAWSNQRGGNIGCAAYHRVLPDCSGNVLRTIDTVLNRQHRGFRAEHRRDERERGGVVVGLDRKDDDVDVTDARGILLGCSRDREVAKHRTANHEAALTNGLEVSAAGDERHRMPGPGEPGAVVAAHRTRTENRKAHQRHSLSVIGTRL